MRVPCFLRLLRSKAACGYSPNFSIMGVTSCLNASPGRVLVILPVNPMASAVLRNFGPCPASLPSMACTISCAKIANTSYGSSCDMLISISDVSSLDALGSKHWPRVPALPFPLARLDGQEQLTRHFSGNDLLRGLKSAASNRSAASVSQVSLFILSPLLRFGTIAVILYYVTSLQM